MSRGSGGSGTPGFGPGPQRGAVSGTSVKHSLSTLASVGGATTGKGTAIINGTSVVRPKQQH